LPDFYTPPTADHKKGPTKRPAYLVVALLLVWALGLAGTVQGCQTMETLHDPNVERAAISRLPNAQHVRQGEIYIDTALQFRNIVTPLAVGQFLLASLLTLSAGLTLIGRGQARRLALQAMAAYAIFLPIDYITRGPVRAVTIAALAQSMPPLLLDGSGALGVDETTFLFYWVYRVGLGVQLAIVASGIFALTRPRVRAFFGALAERARGQEP
jgi:hypothetical protein